MIIIIRKFKNAYPCAYKLLIFKFTIYSIYSY